MVVKTKQQNPQQDIDLLRARQRASDAIKDCDTGSDIDICDDEAYSIPSDSDAGIESSNESDSDTGRDSSNHSDIICHSSECESDLSDDDFVKPKKKFPTVKKKKGHTQKEKHASNESAINASEELMVILIHCLLISCVTV